MNYRSTLIVIVIGLPLSIPISSAQTTPLRFAQRQDVGREINLQPNQRAAIQGLGPICDAQCQAYVVQNFEQISDDARLAFGSLPAEAQDQLIAGQRAEVQEGVEFNAIDDVLANPQMDRFRQLWTQFQGTNGMTSGFASEAMGLSDGQFTELTDLQSTASELTNLCLSNPALSPDQQNLIIQNINNGVIDQSINILENGQLDIFMELCGEPCQFDPIEDEGPATDPDAAPTDQGNADPNSPDSGGDPNEPAEQQRQPSQNESQRQESFGSDTRNAAGFQDRNPIANGNRSQNNVAQQGQRASSNARRSSQLNPAQGSRNFNRPSQANRGAVQRPARARNNRSNSVLPRGRQSSSRSRDRGIATNRSRSPAAARSGASQGSSNRQRR